MAGAFTVVNLSQLPAPNAVEALDFETIMAAMLADLQARMQAAGQPFTALLESDPAYKVLEVVAYRELLVRQRANEAVRAVMLAFAQKADLDHIGANYNVPRLLIKAADDTTIPPTLAVWESDDDYRARIPVSLESYTTAGSEGSYVYHGLSAAGTIKDISAVSPTPGQVVVYVLSRNGDGTASAEEIAAVAAALNAEKVRPMTDQVSVQSASIVLYTIDAELTLYPGPDADVVKAAAIQSAQAYADSVHRNGYDVSLSGVYQALHRPGVDRVKLNSPTANIPVAAGQAPYCTSITVTVAPNV
ncbi:MULTISPECIES: baseplate assembly protein [Enterobacteriaceae]|uniref:baseplate assembly protein n=1 Tax=Enterobacteriaceae TaxID=543 RepID=UPI001FF0F110|nr:MULTISPECIES: baseplate J/gp47 family protein [Enterobacteriaceae]MDT9046509.1 baseplate J/gp47 family protein [Escherichia coli]UOV84368.1 baseplate J/gp47 family protein [Klebsiella pneumoniae]